MALSARPAPYINPYQASGPGAHHINPPPALLLRRGQIKYITTRCPWSNPVTGQSLRSSLISLITLSSVRSLITQIAHHSRAPDLIDDVLAKHNREAAKYKHCVFIGIRSGQTNMIGKRVMLIRAISNNRSLHFKSKGIVSTMIEAPPGPRTRWESVLGLRVG